MPALNTTWLEGASARAGASSMSCQGSYWAMAFWARISWAFSSPRRRSKSSSVATSSIYRSRSFQTASASWAVTSGYAPNITLPAVS